MHIVGDKVGALALACVLACGSVAIAATHPKPAPSKAPRLVDAIAISVNGQELSADPAPIVRNRGSRILVPVVKIYNALGITVSRTDNDVLAIAPSKRIQLHIGSARAQIDNNEIIMDTPAIEINGATYVSLRFVADSLGAQVSFNAKANRVEVISSIVGRNPALTQRTTEGAQQVVGTVSAVDLNSAPESVTVERGASVRTVAITSDAQFLVQDVVTRTSTPASLADVHVGDAVSVILRADGRVDQVIVQYASRSGAIAATSPSAFVLQSGFVVTLDKTTELTLNSQPAKLSDLRVGDTVVIRSNPVSGEKRQIVASRAVAAAPVASPGSTQITGFTITAKGALHAGDSFDVALRGTPGGKATYDIGAYVTGVPLTENSPGVYTARYTVPPGVNFGETSIFGHLTANGVDAPRAETQTLVAVSTTPPQIVDIAPANGQTINNDKPSIFATYRSPTDVGISPSSVTINVNGLDVTASATRTDGAILYSPSVGYSDGDVNVIVTVVDRAGNKQTRKWKFTVRAHS